MVVGAIVAVVVVLAAVVAYKLWKSGKAVTGGAVVSGVEDQVKSAASSVVDAVKTDGAAIVSDVSKKV